MNREHLLAGFFILVLSSGAWSQGHHEVSPEPSVTTQRSTDLKSEGRKFEKKFSATLEYKQEGCAATLGLVYYQNGPDAHVKSTLENLQCRASSGSYILRIRYIHDEGGLGDVEFEETWSRDDDGDIVSEKDYYVGDDLEIRRVSSSELKCECTEPQLDEPSPAIEP